MLTRLETAKMWESPRSHSTKARWGSNENKMTVPSFDGLWQLAGLDLEKRAIHRKPQATGPAG